MNCDTIDGDQLDEILTEDVSDKALEIAASNERTVTIGACTITFLCPVTRWLDDEVMKLRPPQLGGLITHHADEEIDPCAPQ